MHNTPNIITSTPWTIDQQGICPQAEFIPSPNCDARLAPLNIDLLVIHNISLPPQQFGGKEIQQLFTNQLPKIIQKPHHPFLAEIAHLKVSAHFVILRTGKLQQYVSCHKRAWHAGLSNFMGRLRCNDFSIGIELEGSDLEPFEFAQYQTLIKLTQTLTQHYPLRFITGHSDIAPGRKTDPGPFFDWPYLQAHTHLIPCHQQKTHSKH
jgi:N-acetyl-anhydromuramoyl-L-alanine amidase